MSHHSAVELDAASVRFGGYPAIDEVTFTVPEGQFVAIVGPTGCGKSSLLNLVAGLLHPTTGTVRTSGSAFSGVNPDAAYMFQQDALLPWKRVLDNVMLGPVLRGQSRKDAGENARQWIDRVGLSGFEDARVLSTPSSFRNRPHFFPACGRGSRPAAERSWGDGRSTITCS